MSVNKIDVNAVNERSQDDAAAKERGAHRCCENGYSDQDHRCKKQSSIPKTASMTEETEQEVVELAKFLKGSLRWYMAYRLVRFIMFLESIVWTAMDALRAWRMRVSARINDNYKANK